MEVEFVVFLRAVLDYPFLDRALGGDDVGGTSGSNTCSGFPSTAMKNVVVGWISSKYTFRCTAMGADPRPANRGFLVSIAANAPPWSLLRRPGHPL